MELPISLSFTGSIKPTDVTFHVCWPDTIRTPLKKTTRKVLGLFDGSSDGYESSGKVDESVSEYKLAQGNPHEVDFCCVPYGCKYIEAECSITISPELLNPLKCSDTYVKSMINQFVENYNSRIGMNEVITHYLINMCNGDWLWNNKKYAKTLNIEVILWPWNKQPFHFNDIRRNYYDGEHFKQTPHWNALVEQVIKSLTVSDELTILEIKATLTYPTNAQLYPSQTFTEKNKNKTSNQSDNNKKYQTTDIEGITSPIIGCYKVGAAIATIDDWYPNAEKPLRVGRYGVDKQDVIARRHPSSEKDFFSLLRRLDSFNELLLKKEKLNDADVADMHFIIANLIKGGLFQHKGK
ncbi:type I-F CRISPR-associated protein Csy3 [Moritella sp. 24]|uniref:type I-F CRISPR-associated protein Csy3 n=1 Tax=Moritella sp. 24 TaxID=2746230 RepID=UPI001BAB119F|nr:type I-F CRISPR-associated protein Csy3 [Moritella sp. 24]QUM76169.1 type I-F CRISPR-associated protein Csy3 [Moritella sp. 24]